MRPTVLFLFFILQTCSVFSQHQPSWERKNLNGKVKSTETINQIDHLAQDLKEWGYPTLENIRRVTVEFDQYGWAVDQILYYSLDSIHSFFTYKNDSLGNEISSSSGYRLQNRDTNFYEFRNYYDNDSNLVKTERKTRDEPFGLNTLRKYNHNRQITEWLAFMSDSSLSAGMEFQYDSNGNLAQRRRYVPSSRTQDTIYWIRKYTYDQFGNPIAYNSHNEKGELTYKTTKKFDKNNNIIYWTMYNNDDGHFPSQTIKYEYDSTGNWIRKKVYENGKLIDDFKRTIEYF